MRSLFFKIFLWFWLANVLVATVLFLSGRWTHPPFRGKPFSAFMDNMLTLYGQQAVEAYEQRGKPGLSDYFNNLKRTTELEALLIREGGVDLLEQSFPPDVKNAIDQIRSGNQEIRGEYFPWIIKVLPEKQPVPYILAMKMPRPGMHPEFFDQPGVSLLRLGSIVMMGGLVCYGLARYLTAPLRKLQLATRRLAEGDLSVRISGAVGKRGDEIGDLGRDFDFMAERIESLMTGQQRLLRDISHELRSPLTRLNVAMELARPRAGTEAGEFLDRIELEVNRLNDLIGQLLTLARLENQWGDSTKMDINLTELLHQIVEDADFEARSRQCKVHLQAYEQLNLTGIPSLLRSAIENVVRNAIYYTAENTVVDVLLRHVSKDDEMMGLIRISDHGPGVPEENLTRIFQPFYRVADSRDRHTGGTGLGLAITEQAVRLHGGTVRADNNPQGGLVVEIVLPINIRKYGRSGDSEKTDSAKA